MTDFIDRASTLLISEVGTSAVRSLVLAGVTAASLAALRPKSTSVRLFLWTSVLYASMALPVLGWLLPALQVPVPGFLETRIAAKAMTDPVAARAVPATSDLSQTSHREFVVSATEFRDSQTNKTANSRVANGIEESDFSASPGLRWNLIAAALYLLGTTFFLIRFLAGVLLSQKLARRSQIIDQLSIDEESGAARSDRVAMSELISVPLTVGVFRPTILLPADWGEWDEGKLNAVLSHERSHVSRRDPLTQCSSLLYRAFFWFSPLSWWLHGNLATLAEEASDEAALLEGADQRQYARTLLSFVEILQTTPRRVRWQGVSMARVGQAERRLERILSWKGTVYMSLKRSFAIAILVLVVPVVILVASVRPVGHVSAEELPAVTQAAPPAPATAPTGGVSAVAPVAGIPSVGGVPAIAPVAPVAPIAPEGSVASFSSGQEHGFHYSYGFDDEERFVIASGKSDSFTMSGSTQDIRHVQKLKKEIPGDFIWFQRDEESYIIRDQATVDRARKLFAPQEELGKKQAELGKQQEELGRQQEELGKKMEQVRVNVPDLTAELDRLKAKLQKLGPTATVEQVGDLQSEIGELQSKMGEIQSHAGEEQGKLGELQGDLGERQGKLGEQQGELGRQQGELAEKAAKEMKQILDEAIKNGSAKPERDSVKTGSL